MTDNSNHFLHSVLAPLTLETFFSQYWEREPLHIDRGEATHFAKLLKPHHIEQMLSTQRLFYPAVQLTQSDRNISADSYCDDSQQIVPLRLLALHAEGATLVISHAQNYLPGLSTLCRHSSSSLQMPSQANVYLSPPGQQGFNPHYDTHDVFILQVSGSKTFNFYSGGATLPFEHQKHDPAQSRAGTKTSAVTLQPGHSLYIPRGVVHDAQAHSDAPSLHITLGVFPVTVNQLLQEMLQIAAEHNPQLRQALAPSCWLDQQTDASQSAVAMQQLLQSVISTDHYHAAMQRLRNHTTLAERQDCSGMLAIARQARALSADSVIGPRTSPQLSWHGELLQLSAQGQILEFGEPLASAVETLCGAPQTTLGSLHQLHNSQRIALAQQLLKAGIFRVVS